MVVLNLVDRKVNQKKSGRKGKECLKNGKADREESGCLVWYEAKEAIHPSHLEIPLLTAKPSPDGYDCRVGRAGQRAERTTDVARGRCAHI
ncbi:hypothetical protein KC341_g28 [Hortaea werneckii]|nr:hypothetical protein KC341_g28 [Hortaea werneckii]